MFLSEISSQVYLPLIIKTKSSESGRFSKVLFLSKLEKKESIHEFLEKKKEIYLSKMNIIIKKEQTNKL